MTARVDLRSLPAVVYLRTRTLHAVWAAGVAADGSLYHFYTLCHRRIEDPEQWFEVDRSHPYNASGQLARSVHHCKQCQYIIDRDFVAMLGGM